MRKGSVAFANFVCTFGDKGGLLDNQDIVLPAFLTDTLIRTYGQNQFHLYNVKLSELDSVSGETIYGLSGHFVKNIELTREQVVDDNGKLIKSKNSMQSSPSAFFLLVLNTHRLVYFAETNHAPDLKSFEATMASFLKKIRAKKIDDAYKQADNIITKRLLTEASPRPVLKVVPLSEVERITDYLKRFSKVKSVRFRLIKPNHETDAAEVVSAVRQRFGPLEPDRLDIVASRADGMDKTEVAQAVEETTATGNTNIDLKGEDEHGARLHGSNDQFALTVDLPSPAKSDDGLKVQLFGLYKTLLASGKIKLGSGLTATSDKLSKLASLL